ncbi:universal stress protein [Rhodocaloribacter litoris]|uniref:universal stress protein n=1 Tax=Rhodocaloribacter litoris TaxID=2558931 RepID=UPI0014215199|nr:universal stress protein [Rhodocaloribacter litoris]QXD13803.1 universal stress protein [Rhodocaloribacter litoris]
MIKRILVALDPDSDTLVAIRYAEDIARRYGAEVTGLAVVDLGSIEASARGGGIGSMYYAEKLRERLTEETRAVAQQLIASFQKEVEKAGLPHTEVVEEGVPFERIVEDMNYHDLLVVGKDPHFFYGHSKQDTNTLARVVKNTIAPTLVVGGAYHPVKRVLVAYDGSRASARALRRFIHLRPFGDDLEVKLLNIHRDSASESELILRLAQAYLKAHGFPVQAQSMKGDNPTDLIVKHAEEYGADLVVAGAHSVSKIREIAFGSTTVALLKSCPAPLFLDS